MKKAFLLFFFMLIGCGGGGGGDSASTPQPKSLFSQWESDENGVKIDLRDGALGVSIPFTFLFDNGAICKCSFLAVGTESYGNYSLSSCTYMSGGSGDPGCALLNSSGTYTKTETELTVCDSGGCVKYR